MPWRTAGSSRRAEEPAPRRLTAGSSPFGSAPTDVNGDAKLDLVVTNRNGSPFNGRFAGSISYFQGNGDGTFLAQVAYRANGQPLAVSVADLNGDGHRDLTVPTPATTPSP